MKIIKLVKKIKIKYLIVGGVSLILLLFGFILNASDKVELVTSNKNSVLVSVQGEVRYTGTYAMTDKDRILDAIRKAGGVTFLGNQSKLNLADKVSDGMIIIVPKNTEEGLINLNTCEEKDFDRFKYLGLTDTSIKTIVKYSKNNGFTRKEELLEIGIKENVYNKIKEYIIL